MMGIFYFKEIYFFFEVFRFAVFFTAFLAGFRFAVFFTAFLAGFRAAFFLVAIVDTPSQNRFVYLLI